MLDNQCDELDQNNRPSKSKQLLKKSDNIRKVKKTTFRPIKACINYAQGNILTDKLVKRISIANVSVNTLLTLTAHYFMQSHEWNRFARPRMCQVAFINSISSTMMPNLDNTWNNKMNSGMIEHMQTWDCGPKRRFWGTWLYRDLVN